MNKTIRIIIATLLSLTLFNCSTYTVKKDMSKKDELTKTPKWYVKYKREDRKWMYETASSVSPDLELAIKKSTILAKAKLADRINGKMNNQSSINKSETGIDENNKIKKVLIYPTKSKAMNLAFDITPAKYVTGLITERGISEASFDGLSKLFK